MYLLYVAFLFLFSGFVRVVHPQISPNHGKHTGLSDLSSRRLFDLLVLLLLLLFFSFSVSVSF